MATFHIGDTEIFYERTGQGERVVFTHGAWSDGRAWQAVTPHLADRFELVVWDRRGHSRSQGGEAPGSIRQDAGDLASLIEYLGGEPVHLVGNSAGGCVTLQLMTMRPDLVRSVNAHEPVPMAILEDSDDLETAKLMDQAKHDIARAVSLIAEGENRDAAEFFVDNVAVGPGAWKSFPEDLQEILVANAPTAPEDLRDAFDVGTIDVDALASSRIPLMLSLGTESPGLETAATKELARLLPDAAVATIEGAGHIPHRTHPGQYAALIERFAASIAAVPGSR